MRFCVGLLVGLAMLGCPEEQTRCTALSCPVGQVCHSDGECKDVLCQSHSCADDRTVLLCLSQTQTREKPCGENELCLHGRCELAACTPGSYRCTPALVRERCLSNGQGFKTDPCPEETSCHEGACLPESCTDDDNNCVDVETVRQCNRNRTAMETVDCEPGMRCARGACRSVICRPGETGCADETHAGYCDETGTAWVADQTCDPDTLSKCVGGECVPECTRQARVGASYLGCNYRAVELPNLRGPEHDPHPFAVTVANSSNVPAKVHLWQPGQVQLIGDMTWEEPQLCTGVDCLESRQSLADALIARTEIQQVLALLPESLRAGATGSGAWYAAECSEQGRCRLQADRPGGGFSGLRLPERGRCVVGEEAIPVPCFVSDPTERMAITLGKQRLVLHDVQIGGRLSADRSQVESGRLVGLITEAQAVDVLLDDPERAISGSSSLDAYLDPRARLEATDDRPAGWRLKLTFTTQARAGEVPGQDSGQRLLSAFVNELGGFIDARVQSEVLDPTGVVTSRPQGAVQFVEVPPQGTAILLLNSSRRAEVGPVSAGYRLGSSVPVSAFQFNPLCCNFNYSNDASLLLPESAGGDDYVVLSQPQWFEKPGFVSIASLADNTEVTLVLPPSLRQRPDRVNAGDNVEFDEQGQATITLAADEVWTLLTRNGTPNPDLTGLRVLTRGGKGVLVYAGHESMQVPSQMGAPDHVEEMIPPLDTWGRRFIVTPPIRRNPGYAGETTWYRVLAGPGGARFHLSDGELGSGYASSIAECSTLVDEGRVHLTGLESCAFSTQGDFFLEADGPVLVAQLFAGQEAVALEQLIAAGDPSMTIIPPIDQLRSSYLFMTPTTYAADYVTVAVPGDVDLLLDGVIVDLVNMGEEGLDPFLVEQPRAIGDSHWVRYTIRLSDGAHRLESSQAGVAFAASVYAFDAFVSYAYPGGMNLSKSSQ
ncbi:MAG: hypothetical protein CMH50_09840 [Myxococcales bacterium]|nr:hypothetical protein [Myxococcales bacterium]